MTTSERMNLHILASGQCDAARVLLLISAYPVDVFAVVVALVLVKEATVEDARASREVQLTVVNRTSVSEPREDNDQSHDGLEQDRSHVSAILSV